MEIKIKRNKVSPLLKKAERLISSEMIADAAGEIGMADQVRTFQTSGANIGEAWDALAPLTEKWRRKGKGKGRGNKPLLSTSAIPFGMQKVMINGGVALRTNKVVKGIDIALVHDEGVEPYPITAKQKRWFMAQKVFLPEGWELEIPARHFSNFSRAAKKEMTNIPKDLKRKLT